MIKKIREVLYDMYGFQNLTYMTYKNDATEILTTYPEEWMKHYEENNYHMYDYPHKAVKMYQKPILWGDPAASHHSQESKRILHEARAFNIHSGISVPLHTPGAVSIVTFSSDLEQKHLTKLAKHIVGDLIGVSAIMRLSLTHQVDSESAIFLIKEISMSRLNDQDYCRKIKFLKETPLYHQELELPNIQAYEKRNASPLSTFLSLLSFKKPTVDRSVNATPMKGVLK